ncbi:MAG TPA: CapA family protein, partial [Thermomicrobiales bacterium]|nr:CapA family protein [Thermomicrobiales bacterium]
LALIHEIGKRQAMTPISTDQPRTDRNIVLEARASRRDLIIGASAMAAGAALGLGGSSAAQETGLPQGTALVVSPRLPLWDVTAASASAILDGSATNWLQVGSPLPHPIRRVGVDGIATNGMPTEASVADYEALVTELASNPGTIAVAPLPVLDSRVTALRIDGTDPFLALATEAEPVFHVGIAGDMIPGRNVNLHMRGYGDFVFPWRRVAPLLSSFDFTFGNFECVISDTIPFPEDTNANALDFVMGSAGIDGLHLAGFDAVSLANNHSIYNGSGWGFDGFYDTINNLAAAGMPWFGAGEDLDQARAPHVGEVAGKTIALIGIDGVTANVDYPGTWMVTSEAGATASKPGTNPLVEEQILADISNLAAQYDIVIPFFHMGEQYRWMLSEWAIELSRRCVDAGATTVVTSHPHVTQGMEWYDGTPLFYGIGNFIYDQMFTVDTSQGHIVDLTFRGSEIVGFRLHGVAIEDFTQPRLLGPNEQAAFMDRIWRSNDFIRARV